MSHDFEGRGRRRAQEAEKRRLEQVRADARAVLNTEPGRRLLWEFLQSVNVDGSPFNTNAMAQSHATGLQDAGRWWLNLIRDACPEKEAQMRAEAIRAAKERRNNREVHTDD